MAVGVEGVEARGGGGGGSGVEEGREQGAGRARGERWWEGSHMVGTEDEAISRVER